MLNELGIDVGKGGPSGAGWSHIATFLRCAKEHQFKNLRSITPVGSVAQPDALGIGTLTHAGRAAWFGNNCASDVGVLAAMDAEMDAAANTSRPLTARQLSQAKVIVEQYVNYWSKQAKPKVRAVEYLIGPSPLFPGDAQTDRTSRLDDVSEYPECGGKLAVGDLKTTSGSTNSVIAEYSLHGQPLLNCLLWSLVENGEARFGKVRFWVVDVVKKPDNSDKCKFERCPLPITDYMLNHYRESMIGWLRAMSKVDIDSEVPRNYTQCARSFGRGEKAGARACDFSDLCRWGKGAASKFMTNGKFLDETELWK